MKLGPVANACDASPCAEGATGCGTTTGRTAYYFAGATAENDDLRFLGEKRCPLPTQVQHLPIQADVPNARVVVVCRDGNAGPARDDIAVDAIWGECR